MSWGIKKSLNLFLSGMTTGYASEKYAELKEVVKGFNKNDVDILNKIIKTGEFQLPVPDEEQTKEKKPDSDIAW